MRGRATQQPHGSRASPATQARRHCADAAPGSSEAIKIARQRRTGRNLRDARRHRDRDRLARHRAETEPASAPASAEPGGRTRARFRSRSRNRRRAPFHHPAGPSSPLRPFAPLRLCDPLRSLAPPLPLRPVAPTRIRLDETRADSPPRRPFDPLCASPSPRLCDDFAPPRLRSLRASWATTQTPARLRWRMTDSNDGTSRPRPPSPPRPTPWRRPSPRRSPTGPSTSLPRRGSGRPPSATPAIRDIGAGGMGVVRLEGDVRIGRDVAIKRLRAELADDATATTRFLREARLQGPARAPGDRAGLRPRAHRGRRALLHDEARPRPHAARGARREARGRRGHPGAAPPQRVQPGLPRRRAPRTGAAWSTATSSPRTSCSATSGRSTCSTGASRAWSGRPRTRTRRCARSTPAPRPRGTDP